MADVVRKKSKIHGFGIFAARDFKKGEAIIKWNSHKQLSKKELNKLPKKQKNYISYIASKYILVPPEGWVNHSCNPNVRLVNFCYVAKRNIVSGEEITTDYRKESEPGSKMKCNCESKNCCKIITA